jgi:hypothetical protein
MFVLVADRSGLREREREDLTGYAKPEPKRHSCLYTLSSHNAGLEWHEHPPSLRIGVLSY